MFIPGVNDVEVTFGPYQLIIEGTTGYGPNGWIAMDDLRMFPGPCVALPHSADQGPIVKPPITTPSPLKTNWSCNFDESPDVSERFSLIRELYGDFKNFSTLCVRG